MYIENEKTAKNVYKQKSISVQYNGRLLKLAFVFFFRKSFMANQKQNL